MLMIAFGHRKRVGKDTASRFLASAIRLRHKGSHIVTAGFADKVKDVAHQLYFWAGVHPGDFYEEPENQAAKEIVLPKIGKSPRQVWIELATPICRVIYMDTWLDYLRFSIECDICIVKDMRFPNEANYIKRSGGYVFKINRDDAPNNSDIADDPLKDYDGWDQIIENNGSLGELNMQIELIADTIINRIKGG